MKSFAEGRKQLALAGLPATCTFLLSTKDEATFADSDVYASGLGEITGTGYARLTEARPAGGGTSPTTIQFAIKTWATGSATDWPAAVKSIVLVDATNSKLIAAWNLNGTTGRAMNAANTTENATPLLNLA